MGRHKTIETPEIMLDLFNQYKAWTKKHPIKVVDWVGGMGKRITRKKERPLTMEGFEIFCYENEIIGSIDQYFSNYENRYSDFVGICSRIRKIIREDQIAGGMAGIYNPSITQRLNNLVEKVQEDGTKDVTIKVKYERKPITDNPE